MGMKKCFVYVCGCVCLCLVFASMCICLFVCLPVLTSYVAILKALVYQLDPASAQEKLAFEGALRHQEKVQLWCMPYIHALSMQELFAKYGQMMIPLHFELRLKQLGKSFNLA